MVKYSLLCMALEIFGLGVLVDCQMSLAEASLVSQTAACSDQENAQPNMAACIKPSPLD